MSKRPQGHGMAADCRRCLDPYRRFWQGPRAARRRIQLQQLLHRLRLQQAGHVLRRGAGRSHANHAAHRRRQRPGLDGSNGAAYGRPTAHDGSDLRLPRTSISGRIGPIRSGCRKTTSSSSTRTLAPNGSSRRRSRNISPTRTSSNPRPITASIRRPGRARASGAPRKPGTRMRPGSISTPRGPSSSSAASIK